MSEQPEILTTDAIKIRYNNIVNKIPGFPKIFMGSLRTPDDAATKRTPESEEQEMVPIVIPPQFEVNRLIEQAKVSEMRASAGGLALSLDERHALMQDATASRVKALTLHLGIEQ